MLQDNDDDEAEPLNSMEGGKYAADADADSESSFRLRCSGECAREMAGEGLRRLRSWLLEVEMGVVWGVAGVAIVVFVFLSIWFIDPALLTLALQFRQARCSTSDAAFLVGISNCSWTSCRLGCTREVYKCWQVRVNFEFVEGTRPYQPPWASISSFGGGEEEEETAVLDSSGGEKDNTARLYPNVRGCGYPPELNCEHFYDKYSDAGAGQFDCWVSTMDTSIAMTGLDLERAKTEVVYSLVPLFIFIVSVLYAFCRLGVFSVCNPLKLCCPKAHDTHLDMPNLTPKKLFDYKKGLLAKKERALAAFQPPSSSLARQVGAANQPATPGSRIGVEIPATIEEGEDEDRATGSESGGSQKRRSAGSARGRRRRREDEEQESSLTSAASVASPPPGRNAPGGAGVPFRRAVFSASSLVSLPGGTAAISPSSPGTPLDAVVKKQNSVAGSRRDSFDREILDFDLESEDIVSVRRGAAGGGGLVAAVGGASSSSRPGATWIGAKKDS